jgi:hypothetical protein
VDTVKLSIRNIDMESGIGEHEVFQSLRKKKSPCCALLGALIRREQQKQTKDVHREKIFVELEKNREWTTGEI